MSHVRRKPLQIGGSQGSAVQPCQLVARDLHLRPSRVTDHRRPRALALDQEHDRHPGLDAEHVVLRAAELRVVPDVAAEVH